MKKIKKAIIILVTIFISISLINSKVKATNQKEINAIEISEQYKKWDKLSYEEKQKTIQPSIYDISFIDSIKRSKYNMILKEVAELPTKFSLKDSLAINVKNQNKVGSCWAFSLSSILETTMANKNKITGLNYSPMHMDYKASKIFERNVGTGGSIYMAMAYLASGYGPVDEKDFPFESVYDEQNNSKDNYYLTDLNNVDLNKVAKARVTDITLFPEIYKTITSNSITYKDSASVTASKAYSENEVRAIREVVKQHIKEDGAVLASFYSNMGIVAGTGRIVSDYFNNETNAYYANNSFKIANHAVTIVGWDDNYSKTNFKDGNQPLHNGAYIVLNSWGKEFGDNGYFYVSYDDAYIEQTLCGIDSLKQIEIKDYDQMYEYDELGVNLPIYSVNEDKTAYLESGYLANVFSRKDVTKTEYLTEVGVYLFSTEGVEIYVNSSDNSLDKGILVASCTGTNALEAGYHTIKLASPVKLTGTKFVVKAKFINSEKAILPLECDYIASGISTNSNYNLYNPATSNEGESFIAYDGTKWNDLYNLKIDQYTIKDTSACIKAFTTYSNNNEEEDVKVTKVTLNKTAQTIKVGEKFTLSATVEPTNATNKNVTWSSEDETIASVKDGVVTGIKEGSTLVKVTTKDGEYTATCNVTVEKEQQEQLPQQDVKVTGITLDKTVQTIKVGEKFTLSATVEPANATNKNVTWSSEDETIASVKDGVVTGIKEGSTLVKVTTKDGEYTATCNVTVEKEQQEQPPQQDVKVTGITLDKTAQTIKVGEKFTLSATVEPTNATNKNVTWSSEDETIASVKDGVVTGIKEGSTLVKVTTKDGEYTATCNVTVEKEQQEQPPQQEVKVTGVTLNKKSQTIQAEETLNLVATVLPENATNKEVKWSSSNEEVATVSNTGIIKALKQGTTTIAVTTIDGSYSAECILTVTPKVNYDDDIYKEEDNKENKNEEEKDKTKANKILPNTGLKRILALIGIVGIVLISSYLRYNNLEKYIK